LGELALRDCVGAGQLGHDGVFPHRQAGRFEDRGLQFAEAGKDPSEEGRQIGLLDGGPNGLELWERLMTAQQAHTAALGGATDHRLPGAGVANPTGPDHRHTVNTWPRGSGRAPARWSERSMPEITLRRRTSTTGRRRVPEVRWRLAELAGRADVGEEFDP